MKSNYVEYAERRVSILFYVMAFIITMALTIFVVYEPIERRKTSVDLPEKKVIKPENENPELSNFLQRHLKQGVSIDFKSIKDSKTGYFYENGNFSLTLFDYPGYVTAQFFQMTPYVQLADMRVNKGDTKSLEVNLKNAPVDTHDSIYQVFVKVKENNVKAYQPKSVPVKDVEVKVPQTKQGNEKIENGLMRINSLIEVMGKESATLSLEVKHNIRSIVVVDLPNLMNKYKKLKGQDATAEKDAINLNLNKIENYLNKEWNVLLDLKRQENRNLNDRKKTM